MKAKNQQHFTSEIDAKEKLIVYVYEYLIHSGAKQAADLFKDNIGYNKDIKINEGPGFLLDWWCVFWDLYCAAPERRHTQPESSSDARAFHDFARSTPMSPSITQTSPPQQPPPPQFMGPRYGPPPPGQGPRGPPRMQGPPQHGPPGPPSGFMPAASPRYAQHSGPMPHMSQGGPMGFGPGPDQMGPSPEMNRMTPVGGPPPHQVVGPPPPPNGPPPQMVGMPPGQQMGGPPQASPMQGAGPPRNGSQGGAGGWQGNVNYGGVNSPANQPLYSGGPGSNQPNQGGPMMMTDGGMMEVKSSPINGGDPTTPHSDEYVMPVPFGQETIDEGASAEILKLKQSMQEDTTKMFEKEQSEFNLGDYSDSQGKWS